MGKLGTLCANDFVKGLILTVIVAALTVIQNSVSAGTLHIDWNIMATTTITTAIAYLLKNLGTGSGGRLFTNSSPPASFASGEGKPTPSAPPAVPAPLKPEPGEIPAKPA